jgi:hypothetical protein
MGGADVALGRARAVAGRPDGPPRGRGAPPAQARPAAVPGGSGRPGAAPREAVRGQGSTRQALGVPPAPRNPPDRALGRRASGGPGHGFRPGIPRCRRDRVQARERVGDHAAPAWRARRPSRPHGGGARGFQARRRDVARRQTGHARPARSRRLAGDGRPDSGASGPAFGPAGEVPRALAAAAPGRKRPQNARIRGRAVPGRAGVPSGRASGKFGAR